jgi:prepilin-type N-terminal cleavage/methylation domain-containing protein
MTSMPPDIAIRRSGPTGAPCLRGDAADSCRAREAHSFLFARAKGASERSTSHARRSTFGFTLVEVLVVVMIIGFLAAVAIPQFGDASQDARIAALDQDLATVRNAIELYRYQHGELPGAAVCDHRAKPTDAPIAFDGTDANANRDSFIRQMTWYSNADGQTCESKHASFPFGPYLRQGLPANPLPCIGATSTASGVNVVASADPLSADDKPRTGWKYSCVTGEFIANHPDYDER